MLAARAAKGDGRALYRSVFVQGALTTAFLPLDTTAVILKPILLAASFALWVILRLL